MSFTATTCRGFSIPAPKAVRQAAAAQPPHGRLANLTKVVNGGQVNRHYHVGPVTGFVLEGSWYSAERDWVARAGTTGREPPGDIHTLIAGEEGTVTLFILEGALLYIDEHDDVVGHDDVLSHMRMYHDFCRAEGIEPADLDF